MTIRGTLVFELGSEWAPDSPHGLDILEIAPDSRFCYKNRQRGNERTRVGRVDPSIMDEIARALDEAGFPARPAHSIPPGAAIFTITMKGAEDLRVMLHEHSARRFPGYGVLVRRVDEWTRWLRNGTGTPPAGFDVDA